jgi:hypothetical protein
MKEANADITQNVIINEDDIVIVRVEQVPTPAEIKSGILLLYENGSVLVDLKMSSGG